MAPRPNAPFRVLQIRDGEEADGEQFPVLCSQHVEPCLSLAYPQIIGQTFQYANFTSISDVRLVDENGRERC